MERSALGSSRHFSYFAGCLQHGQTETAGMARETASETNEGGSTYIDLWEVPYVQTLQMTLTNLKGAFNLQCKFEAWHGDSCPELDENLGIFRNKFHYIHVNNVCFPRFPLSKYRGSSDLDVGDSGTLSSPGWVHIGVSDVATVGWSNGTLCIRLSGSNVSSLRAFCWSLGLSPCDGICDVTPATGWFINLGNPSEIVGFWRSVRYHLTRFFSGGKTPTSSW